MDVWKFTSVFHGTQALWGHCPSFLLFLDHFQPLRNILCSPLGSKSLSATYVSPPTLGGTDQWASVTLLYLRTKKMFLILRLFWALADLAVSSLGSQSLVIHLFFSNHSRRVQMMSKSKTRLLQSTTIWALNQTQNYTSPSGFSGDKGGVEE